MWCNSAGICRPHRVESIVLDIYPALNLYVGGGEKLTNKISLGVGVIHQGKRFLRNCTHVQLVGNSLRYEDTKTRWFGQKIPQPLREKSM